ncbi:lysyl-tRNA synthetase [Diplocarpon rosae]|nr:lysyl-tRNA synthetase [Diplocarpon rosae]
MSSLAGLRFLRPYLHPELPVVQKAAYARFYSTIRQQAPVAPEGHVKGDVSERMNELKAANALQWPRIQNDMPPVTVKDYAARFSGTMLPSEIRPKVFVTLRGRVTGFRVASSSLVFIDIVQDGVRVQTVLNRARMGDLSDDESSVFREFYHLLRRGDIISVQGNPYVTKRGELSLSAVNIPQILAPSLASLPKTLEDRETRIRNRHVDMLVNGSVVNTLRLRSHIVQNMRSFLLASSFLEVQTPLIADQAGGAIAKPFTTSATEFPDKQLSLRIAPEIWLKRLVIGGLDRVFEIGPVFRNEGLDATHNPEFTTCEFYQAFADLEELMCMTESMLSSIATQVEQLTATSLTSLPPIDTKVFHGPYPRIAFIPAVEAGLGEALPDLASATAEQDIIALFTRHSIPLPLSPTLPRLLDRLSSIYIEPACVSPTFVTYHPACMAPLSKSFISHPAPSSSASSTPVDSRPQLVSARAELFVQHREIANMYEEENSPFAQRQKFTEQLQWKDDENRAGVDESYLEALEWGLPPTGGWGAGVDRLVMLFSGSKRISDVLPFGSLRNVVNLSRGRTSAEESAQLGVRSKPRGVAGGMESKRKWSRDKKEWRDRLVKEEKEGMERRMKLALQRQLKGE